MSWGRHSCGRTIGRGLRVRAPAMPNRLRTVYEACPHVPPQDLSEWHPRGSLPTYLYGWQLVAAHCFCSGGGDFYSGGGGSLPGGLLFVRKARHTNNVGPSRQRGFQALAVALLLTLLLRVHHGHHPGQQRGRSNTRRKLTSQAAVTFPRLTVHCLRTLPDVTESSRGRQPRTGPALKLTLPKRSCFTYRRREEMDG